LTEENVSAVTAYLKDCFEVKLPRVFGQYYGVKNGFMSFGHVDPFAPVITYQDFLTLKEKK